MKIKNLEAMRRTFAWSVLTKNEKNPKIVMKKE